MNYNNSYKLRAIEDKPKPLETSIRADRNVFTDGFTDL